MNLFHLVAIAKARLFRKALLCKEVVCHYQTFPFGTSKLTVRILSLHFGERSHIHILLLNRTNRPMFSAGVLLIFSDIYESSFFAFRMLHSLTGQGGTRGSGAVCNEDLESTVTAVQDSR